MYELIQRKRRKHNCQLHFDSNSFLLNSYTVVPVHVIPEEILPNQKLDFYLKTRYDVYLLRLTNSAEKQGLICPAHKGGLVYIVCLSLISKGNIIMSIKYPPSNNGVVNKDYNWWLAGSERYYRA